MNCGCDPSRAVTQNAATGADNGLSRVASGSACAGPLLHRDRESPYHAGLGPPPMYAAAGCRSCLVRFV